MLIKTSKHAFTLVEVLIVVLILGIIAAITLPKFSNASAVARASMLADDLRILRTQIIVFKGQHCGVSPGYPNCDQNSAPTEDAFVAHMTMASNNAGQIANPGTEGYDYGPYLREVPVNPVNNKSTVQVLGDDDSVPDQADDSHGWIYQPYTCTFLADCIGEDENGKKYIDY